MSKFPVSSISLFSAKSGQHPNRKVPCSKKQSLGMIQTHVPIFLDDKIRNTFQLITYTVPQNCLALFIIHCNSQSTFKTVCPLSVLAQRLSFRFFFLVEGRHSSKIQLGTNVTRWIVITYLIHPAKSFVPFFFHGSS